MSMNPGQTTNPAGRAIGAAPVEREVPADGRDAPVRDAQVVLAVEALGGIDETSGLDHAGVWDHGSTSSASTPASR